MGRPRAGEQPTTEKDFEFPVVSVEGQKRIDYLEKSSKVRKYTSLINDCYALSVSLEETDEMKKYLATVAERLCQALSETLKKDN